MFKLHVVQARFGDCLVLEAGSKQVPHFVLIDGGPPGNYAADLAPALQDIVGDGGKLDLVVISHIDTDHIVGVLELLAAIESDTVSEREPRQRIGGLWHNSFDRTLDPTGDLAQRMQSLMMTADMAEVAMPLSADAFYGLKEGNWLRRMGRKLAIPINAGFPDDLIMVETAKVATLAPLELRIAGPDRDNLDKLRAEWLAWLEKAAEQMTSDPAAAATADSSIPNLSSIVVLASCDGRTVLLTGDARGDHIIDGLRAAKLSDSGKLHVDVLKVQHHGSDRNATRAFFEAITADTYVLSADGRYGNPDYETLKGIVEIAHQQRRRITLLFTNESPASKKLKRTLKPSDYNYQVMMLDGARHHVTLTLSE